MKKQSIRFKTTLLYSGILLFILIIYNIFLFYFIHSILIKDIDEQLRIKAGEISNILHTYEKVEDISYHPLKIFEKIIYGQSSSLEKGFIIDELWSSEFETLKLKKDFINILNEKGCSLIHSQNLNANTREILLNKFKFSSNEIYYKNIKSSGYDLRIINLPFVYKNDLILIIQVASSLKPTYDFFNKLFLISSLCIISIIILSSFVGSLLVRNILAPVVAVTRTAKNISYMDLATRIPIEEVDIEMEQLINSFNNMIKRLENSFKHVSEFNSYIAHELKTPLTIMKGELELALEQTPKEDENFNTLSDCFEETDRMIRITKDLLLLAKFDYKPQIFKFQQLDFIKFFEEIKENGIILSSEKKIKFSVKIINHSNKLFINGDKVHLFRLFYNIISNAIKHTNPYGEINITINIKNKYLHINITDTGKGISEENIHKIFDKFFKVDDEDLANTGSGLGLNIALSIAKAHQGDIKAKSKLNEGTTFTVILPLAF